MQSSLSTAADGRVSTPVASDQAEIPQTVLSEIDATIRHVGNTTTPLNTLLAIRKDVQYIDAWCWAAFGTALPFPTPSDYLRAFIAHHLFDVEERRRNPAHGMPAAVEQTLIERGIKRNPGPSARATVVRRLSTIDRIHNRRGHPSPGAEPTVRAALKETRLIGRTRKQRHHSQRAMTASVLDLVLQQIDPSTLQGMRDRAMILAAWASGGRRRSEIASLQFEDLERVQVPSPEGEAAQDAYLWHLYDSKTGKGDHFTVPLRDPEAVDALKTWITAAPIVEGPVFRRLNRNGKPLVHGLTAASINVIIKRYAEMAGVPAGELTSHGIRSGFLTQAAVDDVAMHEAMAMSTHVDIRSVQGYWRPGEVLKNPAGMLRRTARATTE